MKFSEDQGLLLQLSSVAIVKRSLGIIVSIAPCKISIVEQRQNNLESSFHNMPHTLDNLINKML